MWLEVLPNASVVILGIRLHSVCHEAAPGNYVVTVAKNVFNPEANCCMLSSNHIIWSDFDNTNVIFVDIQYYKQARDATTVKEMLAACNKDEFYIHLSGTARGRPFYTLKMPITLAPTRITLREEYLSEY